MKHLSRTPLQRTLFLASALCVTAAAGLTILLVHQPAFYRQAMRESPSGPQREALARRLVTKASAVHAALFRPPSQGVDDGSAGRWEAVIRDDELNAWLAIDLPRSHAAWLPTRLAAPRCLFAERHVAVGVRLHYGIVSAVASIDAEIVLRDVNQIGITIQRARLGALPIPQAVVARALAKRLAAWGLHADLRSLDGRLALVVHVPLTHDGGASSRRIEVLSITAGELLLAGTTKQEAGARSGAAAPDPRGLVREGSLAVVSRRVAVLPTRTVRTPQPSALVTRCACRHRGLRGRDSCHRPVGMNPRSGRWTGEPFSTERAG